MSSIYLQYLLINCIAFACFYLLGNLALRYSGIRIPAGFTGIFARVLTGLLLCISSIAFFLTKAQTVLAVLIVLLVLGWKRYKKESLPAVSTTGSDMPTLQECIFCLFTVIFFFTLYFSSYALKDFLYFPDVDNSYRAKVSHYLIHYQVETTSLEYVYPHESGILPYHYLEIWLNAILSFVFTRNYLLTYSLVTYTLGVSLCTIGLAALMEHFRKLRVWEYILACLFTFFSSFYFPFYQYIPLLKYTSTFTQGIADYEKIFPIYLFLIATILLIIYHRRGLAICAILAIPVVYISATPCVLLSVFVVSLVYAQADKNPENRKFYRQNMRWAVIVGLFLAGGYQILSFTTRAELKSEVNEIFSFFRGYTHIIPIIVGTGLQILFLYAPSLIVLGILLWKPIQRYLKEDSFWITLSGTIIATALLSWAVMNKMLDAVQLFSNLSIALLNISVFVLFLCLQRLRSRYVPAMTLVIVSICSWNIYQFSVQRLSADTEHAKSYLSQIREYSPYLSPMGVYLKTSSEYSSVYLKNTKVANSGTYLNSYTFKTFPVDLTVFNIPLDSTSFHYQIEKSLVGTSTFYMYVQSLKQKQKFRSIEQAQLDFIDEFDVNYLIASAQATLSPLLRQRVRKEIADPYTGERFMLISHH